MEIVRNVYLYKNRKGVLVLSVEDKPEVAWKSIQTTGSKTGYNRYFR